jgi:hypothetical protein
MIIRRETLNAVLPATTSEDTRYHLNHVQFEPATNRVIATDGHVLLIATDRSPMADEDFPAVPGAEFHGNPEPLAVSADILRAMLGTMPKKTPLPILQTCQLSRNGSDTTATLAATDLTAPRVATIEREDGRFPQYDRVIPSADRESVNVSLAVDVIEALIKSAKAICGTGKHTKKAIITFNVPIKETNVIDALAVTIEGINVVVTGAAMPCRLKG